MENESDDMLWIARIKSLEPTRLPVSGLPIYDNLTYGDEDGFFERECEPATGVLQ